MQIDEQIRQQLARELRAILKDWSINEVVGRMGIRPQRVSELRNGNLARFSIRKLMRLIAMHDYDIELSLRVRRRIATPRPGPAGTVVRYDRFDRPVAEGG